MFDFHSHSSKLPVRSRTAQAWLLMLAGMICMAASIKSVPADDAIAEFMQKYCVACHNADHHEGELNLNTSQQSHLQANEDNSSWLLLSQKIYDRVHNGEMPPSDGPQIPAAERAGFLQHLSNELISAEKRSEASSGRTVLRRLNRVEYENTLRALLGVEVHVRDILPPDTSTLGFDTVSDGLRFSQLQIEKYLEAANVALDAAIDLTEEPERFHKRMSLADEKAIRENLDTPDGTVRDAVSGEKHRVLFRQLPDAIVMFSTGYPPGDFRQFSAPVTGRYRLKASAYAYNNETRSATMRIYAHRFREKRLLGYFEMPTTPREVEFEATFNRGELVQIMPHNVGFDSQGRGIWNVGADKFEGSGLAVQWLEIEGPLGDWPPAGVRTLYPDVRLREIPRNQRRWRDLGTLGWALDPVNPVDDARRVIHLFAERAFRRPIAKEDSEPYVQLALDALAKGADFESATRISFTAILTSPRFLFLNEEIGKLDDYAIASRLSYFLWSSMPDQELLQVAESGRLATPNMLKQQTDRMLNHPNAGEFITNFTGQWLDLRNIKATSPDKQLYPEFDEMLELSMVGETEAFFQHLVNSDLPLSNLIDSDFLMLNKAMATHYGVTGRFDESFTLTPRPSGNPRGGLLTQASILKVTANGTVTSPVLRGAWVMKRLVGKPPQPPPPNVGSVEPDTRGATTIRELLEKHRNSPTCAGCHNNIDPPGFALESFDVIGGWRERYRSLGTGDKPDWKLEGRDIWEYRLGLPVDPSGTTSSGQKFENVTEFKKLLMADQTQIATNIAEKLLTYATGAGIRFSDRTEVQRIVDVTSNNNAGLRTLIHEIVQSPLFLKK